MLVYEDSLGPHGHPSWLARDPGRTFEVDEVVDHAAAALDEAHEEYKRGTPPGHGVRLVVLDRGDRAD